MARLRSLALAQRVVLVIGSGLLLALVAAYVATDGFRGTATGAWFAYAPADGFTFARPGRPSWVRTMLVPGCLIVIWTVWSAWLLATRTSEN